MADIIAGSMVIWLMVVFITYIILEVFGISRNDKETASLCVAWPLTWVLFVVYSVYTTVRIFYKMIIEYDHR